MRLPGSRERILSAALACFSETGFDAATTRAIASRAGVNLGLIKYHFGTKEALWRAAVDRAFEALWSQFERAGGADLADRDALARAVAAAVRFAAANPALIRLMNDECKRDNQRMRWLVETHGRRLYESTSRLLDAARRAGLVPNVDPIHLFYIFIGAVGMVFSQAPECRLLGGEDPASSPEFVERHAEAVVQWLL